MTKIENRKKDILILGKGPTQDLEKMQKKCIQLILLKIIKNSVWVCIIMKQTVIYLLMVEKLINLKQKILKLCLGIISKDWTVDNMKKTGLNWHVYDFSVDHDAIAVDHVFDIHKYLMKKKIWYKNV